MIGRPRSSGVAGPSDRRFVTADEQLKLALSVPFTIHDSLRVFLRAVYGNRELMAEPQNLADKIYGLYSDSGVGSGTVTVGAARDFVKKLLTATTGTAFLRPPYLQNEIPAMTLTDLVALADEKGKRLAFTKACTDFIYFHVSLGRAAVRVYVNVRFDSVGTIVTKLLAYVKGQRDHGVVDFKVVGPAAIAGRKDAIVVYADSKATAQRIATELGSVTNQVHLNTGIPGMTTEAAPGIGLGAEPVWQGTGMGGPKMKASEDTMRHDATSYNAQSFGTIRSELIAMAIMNFNASKGVVGDSFDMFAKFVGVAFRGYGLDPARPGD